MDHERSRSSALRSSVCHVDQRARVAVRQRNRRGQCAFTGGDTLEPRQACGVSSTVCRYIATTHAWPSTGCSSGPMRGSCPDSTIDRDCPRRRHDLRHPAQPLPRTLVAAPREHGTVRAEDRPRYTPTTTFQTFPFPEGLTPDIPAADYANDPRAIAIAEAARRLVELRDRWLNPPEWVEWVEEPVAGIRSGRCRLPRHRCKELGRRTLTNLYNERPQCQLSHSNARQNDDFETKV